MTEAIRTSVLGQYVLNQLLGKPRTSLLGRAWLRALREARKRSHWLAHRLVTYQVGEVPMVLPLDHNFPHLRKDLPQYSLNLGRLVKYAGRKYPDLTLIDIGANVGDSAAVVRLEAQCPILCIEGDPGFFELLRHNCQALRDVVSICAYVGAEDAERPVEVQRLAGSASLIPSTSGSAMARMRTLDALLTEAPKFARAKFVKIDTDGFDCRILMRHTKFLQAAKPVALFEYAPFFFQRIGDDGFKVFSALRESGYKTVMFYDYAGYYLASVDLDNQALLRDLHCYFEDREGRKYADVCAFHGEDRALAAECRGREMEFFARFREKEQ
jgi:FkbM family methyltransferase